MTQEACGAPEVAPADEVAQYRGAYLAPRFGGVFGDSHHVQPGFGVQAVEAAGVAPLVVAEAVVVAHDERLDAQAADQQVADEDVGREAAECLVERNDDQVVDAGPFEQQGLLLDRREQLQPLGTAQGHARMRIERKHDAFAAPALRLLAHGPEQRAVACVHAVVGAHGGRGAAEVRQGVETVVQAHALLSFSLTK